MSPSEDGSFRSEDMGKNPLPSSAPLSPGRPKTTSNESSEENVCAVATIMKTDQHVGRRDRHGCKKEVYNTTKKIILCCCCMFKVSRAC